MRLTKIKLSGFKSFATHTVINVDGDRVAIVGPNGCGKSNVIDAVRWVLGESSAKHLRGELMQDVIFNGSDKRKAVSRATVALVFDNSEKGLSGLWNTYAEVEIKRLISRSGDSIYYINNQVVRRRDITELFLGTGVGTRGYAVIEQGMISRIIESKPEELRLFLEEAAGVSKYREKRKEAISRLQDTKDNLVRLEDIQGQLIKQIEILQVQAIAAKYYQDLQTKLGATQLIIILLKMDKATNVLSDINLQIAPHEKELAALVENLVLEEHVLNENQAKQIEQESKLHEITMVFNTQRTNLARLEERKTYNTERLQNLSKDYNDLLIQKDGLSIQIEDLNLQISELQDYITTTTSAIEEDKLVRENLAVSFANIEQQYQDANKIVDNLVTGCVRAKHELELLNNTKVHKSAGYNNLLNRQKKLEQELHGLDFNQGYFSLQEQINNLSGELTGLAERLDQDKNKLLTIKQSHTHIANNLTKTQNQQISISSKISMVGELIKAATDNKEIQQIINCSDKVVYLYQLLVVDSGYEIATQTVLNNILAAIVVDNPEQLKLLPESLFSLWFEANAVINIKPEPNSLAGFVKLRSDKLSQIYTMLNEYIVADNFAHAQKMLSTVSKAQKIVTLDGHIVTANYVVFNANSRNNHILEYQNQQEQLTETQNELDVQCAQLDEELIKSQIEIDAINERINQADILFKEKQQLKHELELEFKTHEQIYIQTKNHHEKIQQELSLLSQEIHYLQDEQIAVELKIKDQQSLIDNLQIQIEAANIARMEYETGYNLAKIKLSEIDNQLNQKNIDNQLLGQKITILNKGLEEKTTQINILSKQGVKLIEDKEKLEHEQQINQVEELSGEISELTRGLEEQREKLSWLNHKTTESRNKISGFQQNQNNIQEKLNRLRLKEQEQLLFLQNQQELLDSLALPDYDKAETLAQNKNSLSELQSMISKLQQEIDRLGLVNLKAIEDLEQITAKNSALLEQITDLTDGMNQLEGAIAQIDQESRVLLDTTYTKVCESFAIYFKTLFGGGSASLELATDDILNSGVQIFVQPPGKKNSGIHLLSGGEKALAAVSLIFAFFNLNPAPFCLLDEVDAPLDDANTSRFCKLVHKLSGTTQFVFISHNRLTMEMADQLIGVTMQEQGVSTTVSVSLVEAVAHAS